jgi:PAS domain S-box-containing protein
MDKPLVVAVSRDLASVFAPWRADLQMHGLIFGVLTLGGMVALYIYQKRHRATEKLAQHQHEALQGSEARQHAIFDASPDALLISDERGTIVQANLQVERLLGYTVQELIGQSIEVLVPHSARLTHPRLRDEFTASPDARRDGHVAVTARCKDGSECDVEVSLSRIETPDGRLFVSALRDIRTQKKAAAELLIAATAFEAQEGMVVTDAHSVILRCNRAFSQITGYSADEAVGRKMNFLKSNRHDAGFWLLIWQSIHQDGAWRGEIWNQHKNGEIHPHWLTISAVRAEDGLVTHYVGTYTDISEQKNIEEKLLRQNNMLSSIIKNFPGGVSVVDAELRHVTHNDLFAQMMDFPAELFAKPDLGFEDFIHYNVARGEYGPGDGAQQLADAMARARSFEAHKFERTRPNGRCWTFAACPCPIRLHGPGAGGQNTCAAQIGPAQRRFLPRDVGQHSPNRRLAR